MSGVERVWLGPLFSFDPAPQVFFGSVEAPDRQLQTKPAATESSKGYTGGSADFYGKSENPHDPTRSMPAKGSGQPAHYGSLRAKAEVYVPRVKPAPQTRDDMCFPLIFKLQHDFFCTLSLLVL